MRRSSRTSWLAVLVFLLLISPWARRASAQESGSASTTKPPVADVAKAQPSSPASPDTQAQRVSPTKSEGYVIGAEDIITINVWKEPEMSRQVPVRPDGMISLPLLGDVKAQGFTPVQLQDQLTTELKKFVSDPQVTVIVNEVHSLTFNIVGQVQRPGYYPLTRRMTVLDAIALSGGFRDFAKVKKVYVLRTEANGQQERLRFNYKNVIRGKDQQENVELQPRDTIVVP
jgi:polysaccharide biosynthesis/export protein